MKKRSCLEQSISCQVSKMATTCSVDGLKKYLADVLSCNTKDVYIKNATPKYLKRPKFLTFKITVPEQLKNAMESKTTWTKGISVTLMDKHESQKPQPFNANCTSSSHSKKGGNRNRNGVNRIAVDKAKKHVASSAKPNQQLNRKKSTSKVNGNYNGKHAKVLNTHRQTEPTAVSHRRFAAQNRNNIASISQAQNNIDNRFFPMPQQMMPFQQMYHQPSFLWRTPQPMMTLHPFQPFQTLSV